MTLEQEIAKRKTFAIISHPDAGKTTMTEKMLLLGGAIQTAGSIKAKKSDIGILVCGSGTGMAISANKTREIRAAVCYNLKSTRLSRQHNNANIIALGSRLTKKSLSLKLVEIFLKTKFEGGRHLKRIKKI